MIFKDLLFVIKYLSLKLNKSLSKKSIIFRIEKNKIIILVQESDENIVNKIVDGFNKIYNDLFSVESFESDTLDLLSLYSA